MTQKRKKYTERRKKYIAIPEGVQLGEIVDDRLWVIHPTKGYRTRSVFDKVYKLQEIPLLAIFKVWCERKLG